MLLTADVSTVLNQSDHYSKSPEDTCLSLRVLFTFLSTWRLLALKPGHGSVSVLGAAPVSGRKVHMETPPGEAAQSGQSERSNPGSAVEARCGGRGPHGPVCADEQANLREFTRVHRVVMRGRGLQTPMQGSQYLCVSHDCPSNVISATS